jgi:hypothetical protein
VISDSGRRQHARSHVPAKALAPETGSDLSATQAIKDAIDTSIHVMTEAGSFSSIINLMRCNQYLAPEGPALQVLLTLLDAGRLQDNLRPFAFLFVGILNRLQYFLNIGMFIYCMVSHVWQWNSIENAYDGE